MDVKAPTLRFKGPFALAGKHAPIIFTDPISAESGVSRWPGSRLRITRFPGILDEFWQGPGSGFPIPLSNY
jgi:hypothetical protein